MKYCPDDHEIGSPGYRCRKSAFDSTGWLLSNDTPPYIDDTLGGGKKQGYTFTYALGTGEEVGTYTVTAAPVTANVTGVRTFFVNTSGVIYEGTDDTGSAIQ